MVIYPKGLIKAQIWETSVPLVGFSFNGGGCCPGATDAKTDDIQFTLDLIKYMTDFYSIDSKRIYATGMSNGGFMVNRIGCELSAQFAAIASVSGPLDNNGTSILWKSDDSFKCEPTHKMPILHVHGGADPVVPIAGSSTLGFPKIEAFIGDWVERNGMDKSNPGTVSYSHKDILCKSWGSHA